MLQAMLGISSGSKLTAKWTRKIELKEIKLHSLILHLISGVHLGNWEVAKTTWTEGSVNGHSLNFF